MNKFNKGQSLVELMVVIGLLTVMLPGLITAFVSSREGRSQQQQRLQANAILKETQDAIRSAREKNWETFAAFTTAAPYHPAETGTSWTMVSGIETLPDSFSRQVIFSNVTRNNSGNIDPAGTITDPSTKKVDIKVSWENPYHSEVDSSMYLTRFRGNLSHIETNTLDFDPIGGGSEFNGTNAQNTGSGPDGEVVLAHGGSADWCNPGTPIKTLDLTGQGETRAVVAQSDFAFTSSGGNNSGRDFWNVTISNNYPPNPVEAGTYDANGVKANDVFGESHFTYLATDKNSNEIIILDVSTSVPSLLLNIDVPGNTNGKSIFVYHDYLFITTTDNNLYRYLLASDRKSATLKGSINLTSIGNSVFVSNNYAFIAMNSTTNLRIIDSRNPDTLSPSGTLSLNNQIGQDIFANPDGTRTYLVTQRSSDQNEFFIINTTNKSLPTLIGSGYDTGAMNPQGLTVIDERAIMVGLNNPRYQVVSVNNDEYGQVCIKQKDEPDDIYAISSTYATVNGVTRAYSYIMTANSSSEFQIIEGGTGGGSGFVSTGTFESNPFTLTSTYPTAFNRFIAHIQQTSPTTLIQMQVAVANQVSGSCSGFSYSYVGPNGNNGAYFTSADNATIYGTIPFGSFPLSYQNPNRCFRYKLNLSTTDSNQTPTFHDITVNYSP